ncbi:probable crossover junction endonuclease EME2 isoform X2 [Numida meleagris]|uniref:probable crossover junction endonuclease EME2 isoform X2 n=1 Tax=Numida meleagris TaxID=8996 RepID=UPI000B3E269B|nr:probable crossover junction endonuclease EME2 isoform X2 [Numida meleagris]
MAGSERCRRARAAWEVSDSEPEAEPKPRGPSAAPEGSPPAAAAARPKRRRAAGEAEARRRERQRRKEREALEKREKREAAAAWRLLRPERCLRLLEVCVDPGFLEDPGSDIWIEALSSLECKHSFEPQAIPRSITWRRNMPSVPSAPDDCMVKTEEEKEVLVLLEPADFLKRLYSLTQAQVVLQLWGNIDVQFLDTWQEFGEHVSALTKAIARRPYKSQLEMQELSFCTAGVSGRGLRVEKDGTGLWQVWKRQIQQFNRVSPATAAAIAEAYPSPSLLVQAYEECSTEDEKLSLLSNIPVKSDISGKDHRVGPDLSRRIYLFMVSTNPDLILDLTV